MEGGPRAARALYARHNLMIGPQALLLLVSKPGLREAGSLPGVTQLLEGLLGRFPSDPKLLA